MSPSAEDSEHAKGDSAGLEKVVREFLAQIGEDPTRTELLTTPGRVAQAWRQFTSGYDVDITELLADGIFDDPHDGQVLVRDIDFYSMCEHHLVPFFGKCHVAYLPRGRILGLSKVARIVDTFARRLQVQERLTTQIADALEQHLEPRGVAVVVEAQHLCMMMRGVERDNAVAVTSAMRGEFRSSAAALTEFYHQIGRPQDL
ncbi:MAG: GTP cyclohydrolase I FolE [Candidatus Krumholzibacteriota bacterium]|nr:GTP cyclohydrolase I FolE [Candidatus Krumholzibacteriota bacterium]